MRRIAVLVALVLAFAAGWFGRGCAGESEVVSPPTTADVAKSAATPAAQPPQSRTRPTPPVAGGRRETPKDSHKDTPTTAPEPLAHPDTRESSTNDQDFRKVTGVVVDSVTLEPVADVRILLGPVGGGWHGSSSAPDGTFDVDLEPDWHAATDRLVIRAGRDGYRPARVPIATATVRVELEKFATSPRPGRIVGVARGEDGKPLTGRICVCIRDDIDLHSPGIWTNADANGRFVLEGIDPGHWTAELSESSEKVDLTVPDDGETSIEIRAKFDRAPTGIFAGGDLTQSSYDTQYARLSDIVDVAVAHAGVEDPFSDPVARHAMWQRQQLEYQWQRVAPGRDVVVTGLPAGAAVQFARAEGACYEWRARVQDGAANFTSIPFGKWRAILVRPGEPDAGVDVDVVKGDGALTIDMPAVSAPAAPPARRR